MIDFILYFLIGTISVTMGGLIAGYLLFILLRNTIYSPKLYFRNIQIVPTKGDIDGDIFKWGGLILTGEICNDSDHWAYNVAIKSIIAELPLKSPIYILNKMPLRLVTELPRNVKSTAFPGVLPTFNIKPGEHITTSIKIITRKEVAIQDFKLLIQELRMLQLKAKFEYGNTVGGIACTHFWIDLHHARFVHFFTRGLGINFPWANFEEKPPRGKSPNSRVLELESEIS